MKTTRNKELVPNMKSLLSTYNNASTLEDIIKAAENVKVFAARHPTSVLLPMLENLTLKQRAIWRKAILTVTGL